jgi:hypothetical protein
MEKKEDCKTLKNYKITWKKNKKVASILCEWVIKRRWSGYEIFLSNHYEKEYQKGKNLSFRNPNIQYQVG